MTLQHVRLNASVRHQCVCEEKPIRLEAAKSYKVSKNTILHMVTPVILLSSLAFGSLFPCLAHSTAAAHWSFTFLLV